MGAIAMRGAGWVFAVAALSASAAAQQPYPDLLYYKFDEGGGAWTANLAAPGAGLSQALVNGQTLAAAGGQFGGGLRGTGGTAATNYVDTGWVTHLPGSFTIAFWLDLTAVTTSNPFMYVLGDVTAGSFRCFTNGVAGAGGIVLRQVGGLSGPIIPGGASPTAPHHVAWVYDSSAAEIRGYLDGVFVAATPQGAFTVAGSANFKVGGYDTFTSLLPGVVMDEFRLYGYALTDQQIAATWNVSLGNPPSVYCTAGTTTNGCVPSIAGVGTPSASAGSGFVLGVSGVEGGKQGLIFYGLDNSGFTPLSWGSGASFLCVKPPTQRTTLSSSGGTPGQCDGVLALDWNSFRAANPGALGQPFAAGQHVFAQGWFRDPPAPKTTNLSDALEFSLQP